MSHFADAVDALDAAVFSGDGLWEEHHRVLFKRHLDRWQVALADWERMAAELEEEEEQSDQDR